jgi:hypothetical protein
MTDDRVFHGDRSCFKNLLGSTEIGCHAVERHDLSLEKGDEREDADDQQDQRNDFRQRPGLAVGELG